MSIASSIEERLEALPRKVGVPLRQLLAVGQISEEVIGTVLDAADLAGQSATLLAFAVGLLHLQSRGVPVSDVVRLARAQGRRIRLDWSAKRWEDEHNRLSRAATLQCLARENVQYNLAAYEAYLPKGFPGYLIRSSRRLGMEGLRQRHCIAGYHAHIQAGYCAIAVVLLARQRWTVQLALTGRRAAPLRAVQIRSRFNETPSATMRHLICARLGIGPGDEREEPACPSEGVTHLYLENLRTLLPVLREHHVKQVTVCFDGGGDSGSIDRIEYGEAAIDAAAIEVDIEVNARHFQEGRWVNERGRERKDLNAAIEELTNDYLEEVHVNWWDNDGGFGHLTIDVEEGTVQVEVSVRYTESSCEYGRTLDISSGEEV